MKDFKFTLIGIGISALLVVISFNITLPNNTEPNFQGSIALMLGFLIIAVAFLFDMYLLLTRPDNDNGSNFTKKQEKMWQKIIALLVFTLLGLAFVILHM